jgi:hypothetical protein
LMVDGRSIAKRCCTRFVVYKVRFGKKARGVKVRGQGPSSSTRSTRDSDGALPSSKTCSAVDKLFRVTTERNSMQRGY